MRYLILFTFILSSFSVFAQQNEEKKKPIVQFNGLGRTILTQTALGGTISETDTTSAEQLSDGEFLLDLNINATPNENTEIQSILRLRNEFGGFFGAGVTVEIRELWARGIIGNVLKYRVGDMDLVMTPYTLFNFEEEGMVNEPEVFKIQRDVAYYEQFYMDGNTRRYQGGKLDFGLKAASVLKEADFTAFLARLRGTDFINFPSRFIAGGRADLLSQLIDSIGLQARVGLNLVHVWEDLESGDASTGFRNSAYTVDFDVSILDKSNLELKVKGEAGSSAVEVKEKVEDERIKSFDEYDGFINVGLHLHLKPSGWTFSVGYMDIGPDFFNMAAQSRRLNLDDQVEKTFYNRIGNQRMFRTPALFDFTRDRAMYTFQLTPSLMNYDPRYSNTLPYGIATPNRTGFKAGIQYNNPDFWIEGKLDAYLLDEIRGQGTFELKSFQLVRASADLHFHKLIGRQEALTLTLGVQNEQTERGGLEVEQVDLTSTLIDLGLEAEIFTNFDILLGAKLLTAEGNDYIPLIENFNDIRDFPDPYIIDDTETLIGAGIRYRFNEDIYLTLQYNQTQVESNLMPENNYELEQFLLLYNMNF